MTAEGKPPAVTVIIPAHNYGRYLPATLQSVRAQSLNAWECIIVDDGSTDDTLEVASRAAAADPRFQIISRPPCRLGEARNVGLAASSAPYVQFLDADDLLETRKLEDHARFLDEHPEVDVVYADAVYFDAEDPASRQHGLRDNVDWMPRLSGDGDELLAQLVERNIMVVNAPVVRRSALEAVGGFARDLSALEDWDLWLRLAVDGGRFVHREAPGTRALVRAHDRSMSRDLRRMLTATHHVRTKVGRLVSDAELKQRNRTLLLATEARLGVVEGLNGDLKAGLRRLVRAATTTRRPAWLLWAAILPLAAQSFLRPIVRWWRPDLIARPKVGL